MRVILFEIGNFPVRSYGLIVVLAMLFGMGVTYYLSKGTKYQKHVVDITLLSIVGAVIGARFWHVFFFQWWYFSKHLDQIFSIWNGGLSILGGLVGGFLTGAIYAWRKKLNFWELADVFAPGLIFGQAVGRIACLLNGDAFGSPTGTSFGLVYPKGTIAYDTYGSQPLWPAEVWEGQWDFIVFGLLLVFKNKKWPNGFIFLAYNMLYSLGRFMLEFLRGDSPRYLWDFTAGQWTSIVLFIISLVFMGIIYVKTIKKTQTQTSM